MSESATETTEASGDAGTQEERLSRVEAAVGRIEQALARLVPGSHAEAQQRTEAHLARPTTIEEQVQAELAKRDKLAAEQQAAAAEKAEQESLRERLAKLEERPPAPPRSPLQRFGTGWG